jgi:hypothetical protein
MNAPLAGCRVWVSISDSPDLAKLGFGEQHLKDTFLEFARYILAAGADIVYGGDLRRGGYTRALFELVDLYGTPPAAERRPRIYSFLAWPRGQTLSPEEEERLAGYVRFVKMEPPPGLHAGFDDRASSALALTDMRRRAHDFVHESRGAQLVMGGKVSGFSGSMPGLLEEVSIAAERGTPLFVIGAFGGAARDIGEAMFGESPARMRLFPAVWQLAPRGFNNGLSADENRTLVTTSDLRLALRLTLEGLVRIAGRS